MRQPCWLTRCSQSEGTSENSVKAKFGSAPARSAYLRRDHNTAGGYYRSLMYDRLRTSDALHKKPCRIGSGLWGTSEKFGWTNFAEFTLHALW
jgi:hypothetical protein